MKLGLVGPSGGDLGLLREALEFLVIEAGVDQALYLGNDESVDGVVTDWAEEIMEGSASLDAFLDRVMAVTRDGQAQTIDRLLRADAEVRRLGRVRKLPPPPARAIELVEDRIVTAVYDKAVLDEDDIANATLVVYGKSDDTLIKRFGPRHFFTPGPLSKRRVAVVEPEPDGQIVIALYETTGAPVWREVLSTGATSKLTVAS
jgi:hypothetical protein